MVSKIRMNRVQLLTKEEMENYVNGKMFIKDSVNDDLDSLFEDIRLGKPFEPFEHVDRYFLPKLTKEELKLVEIEDENFMETFTNKIDPDVDEVEMAASESDSKFVWGFCTRSTFTITNSSKRKISIPRKVIKTKKNRDEQFWTDYLS